MAMFADAMLDAAIAYAIANGSRLALCSSEPANYAAIAAAKLAEDSTVTCGAAQDGASTGRRTVVPICDCVASANGNASHWALHNGSSILVATGAMAATVAITSGITYQTSAFSLTVADPT